MTENFYGGMAGTPNEPAETCGDEPSIILSVLERFMGAQTLHMIRENDGHYVEFEILNQLRKYNSKFSQITETDLEKANRFIAVLKEENRKLKNDLQHLTWGTHDSSRTL